MAFREELKNIGDEFAKICCEQREIYFALSDYQVDVDTYTLLKPLYDEDKAIRLRDSYNLEQVEHYLYDLKDSSTRFNVDSVDQIFLNRFIAHIDYNLQLIGLIKHLDRIEQDGKSVEDRILFLLNHCIISERTGYFQGLFISKLNELNAEVAGVNNADYGLFYRVGALNFKRHLYSEAISQLDRAVAVMQNSASSVYGSADILSQTEFRKTLFKVMMLRAVSYEFQGDFTTAMRLLVGDEHISTLKNLTATKSLYTVGLVKQQFESESLDVIVNPEQENVIYYVQSEIVDRLCSSPTKGSCLAFAVETDKWLSGLPTQEKKKIRFLDSGKNHEYFLNEKFEYDKKYVYFENENAHEVLHILSHTLNEHGVAERSRSLIDNEKNSEAGQLLIAARALMLFVAKNQRFMIDCQKCLTCLATIYAEVGDFESAKAQLLENVDSNYYKNKDLLVQAEIEFFYYLISLMDNPNSDDELRERFYQKYINCCYNHFDYDALTQIEMYRFKYSVATAILMGSSADKKDAVVAELQKRQIDFGAFIESLQSVFISDWTKNEHDKINIMFQFLMKYYRINEQNDALSIVDLAKKYLYLYAKSVKFRGNFPASILSEDGTLKLIEFLDHVFHQPVSRLYEKKEPIQIRNCIYHDISSKSKPEIDAYIKNATNDSDNIYFITTSNVDSHINNQRHIWTSSAEEKVLQYFLIHCAFDSMLYDFVNPQNIFILVPFVGAEPLKYQLDSFNDLLLDIRHKKLRGPMPELKASQGSRIAGKFLKNYNLDNISDWSEKIFEDFPATELALWNDENIDTVYSKERFYMRCREYPHTQCYPLMNHQEFISTLEDIINGEGVDKIHTPCPNGECCQYTIDWHDKVTEKLNTFFCLRSFCVDRLYSRKIIVKYSSRKKQWRIVVVKAPISLHEIILIQAHICDNDTYMKNCIAGKTIKSQNTILTEKESLDETREVARINCESLYDEANKWFKVRVAALQEEEDTSARKIYERGDRMLIEEFVAQKTFIQNAIAKSALVSVPDEFSDKVRAIKVSVEDEVKKSEME